MKKSLAAELLTDGTLRKVFDRVVNACTLEFSQIEPEVDRKTVAQAVDELKTAGLIAEQWRMDREHSVYYVNARGLGAHRELRRFEKKLFDL